MTDTIQKRKARGKKSEQELVEILRSCGWNARRSAASGVGAQVTDVEACNSTTYLAIEVKSSRRDYALIPRHQIKKIQDDLDFIHPFGQLKIGLVAAKFPGERPPWVLRQVHPTDFERSFIKVRRGEASDWVPTGEDTKYFSLKESEGYELPATGRPRTRQPEECPTCHKSGTRLRYRKVVGDRVYEYVRYRHPDGTEHYQRFYPELPHLPTSRCPT